MPEEKNESSAVELSREEFAAIQNQVAALTQQLAIAQSIAAKAQQRTEEMTNLVNRLQADFDNYRKRTNENSKKLKDEGMIEVIERLIPLLDTMRQGIAIINDEKVAEGLKMVYKQFNEMLSSFGVTEIQALGEQFDPNLHNAVMQVKVKDSEHVNVIVEVFNKGYRMGDRIIRHSVVKVGK
ncbi:MAG: nucleotide exchange factor GrpE [Clostridiales bacterium]|jgi:molecular chaperone GrpE|nr:nucleotide exchange factor GrpE [Clostridiales bacterium]